MKKYRLYLIPLMIFVVVIIAFSCFFLWNKNSDDSLSSFNEESDTSVIAKTSTTPGPVTEYLKASELVDEATITVTLQADITTNSCTDLSVPTYITKVDDTYFLVDCYHDQVIYNDNLTAPLTNWKVMTNDMSKGHTIASDGTVYLIDDTENHRILIFEKKEDKFVHTQTFSDIGNRPHYVIYDEATDTFYAWSSMSGEMYLFRHNQDDTRMYLTEIRKIQALNNVYVRSFTILDNEIYFVSGNSTIIRADLETFEILETYPVPDSMAGMIQLTKIQNYYYITVSTDITGNQDYATILRTKDLSTLMDGEYEDIYHYFIGGGTPYYITCFDNAYYLTEHRLPGHSVWRFQVTDDEIVDVESVY